MCILFIYKCSEDPESDYSLIIATNRDEFYERPAQNMGPWEGEANVFAGKDVRGGGTWLAISSANKKIGVMLNHPVAPVKNGQSRGKIPIDYVKSELSASKFVDSMKDYFQECSGFIFVTLDIGKEDTTVHSYTSHTEDLIQYNEKCLGFGNSAPATPFTKVEAGRKRMQDICGRLNKATEKEQLVNELFDFLKWDEKHLPDPVLERQHPQNYEDLSSVYVSKANIYGTRTHTLVLLTKDGKMDIIEMSLQPPIDMANPQWKVTELQCKL
ncbi:transport and Golgi organization protein 2 [Amyelois transitella]|uniref:transport and Golgi organization protein 2 n=1 Tax=Amyelois transitella TaxID=680683 RepID=UPI00298F76C4|nr:transport and Golgi organization protein 2 [Amyelois transitella]XP_013184084.2 transport and Golgi organization protein 2 [Amyelois transitella]XP_013184085.2 transport and Golgi organization protein 2 [Amyelois transitella]